ncbi:hypothetical protein EMIT0P74_50102 [Pseudomonas sp. IT-P74]
MIFSKLDISQLLLNKRALPAPGISTKHMTDNSHVQLKNIKRIQTAPRKARLSTFKTIY